MRERELHQLTEEDFQDIRCRVRNVIRKRLLGESDREDAEQEVAIRLMKRGKKFRKNKGGMELIPSLDHTLKTP